MSDSEDAYYDSDDGADYTNFDDDEDDIAINVRKDKGKDVDLSVSFKSLSPEDLRAEIDREIDGVMSVLGVDRDIALIFLMHYRWNRDKLIERYFESPSRVLSDVGDPAGEEEILVTRPGTSSDPPKKRQRRAPSPAPPDDVCGVCFDEISEPSEVPRMKCRHAFCRECWSAYLAHSVKSEGQCAIRCMGVKCKNNLSESFIENYAESEVYDRWRVLVSQSFVSSTSSVKFCPAPSCTETVQCLASPSTFLLTVPTVTCSDGHSFCFGCGLDEGHTPVICKIADAWLSSKDSGTTEWLTANTRKCPKCAHNIEKSGGCNRMVCRHCRFQFCWVCLRDWNVHGYNQTVCNSYVEPRPTAEMDQAKANLERWMFYYDRFNNHELSTKLDQEIAERVEYKMDKMQKKSNLSWIETHFMQHAVDELTKCRRTLKWTYAMAHFLSAGNKKQMFEDIQADLERAVEELSQLVDEPIEDICSVGEPSASIKDLRQKVMDKAAYVKKRHGVLLTDIAKGMADSYWEWTISVQ